MSSLPSALVDLEPSAVWRHFAALAACPRPSKEEAQVRAYVVGWAEASGFAYDVDAIGNVIVRVPGRGAGVGAPIVIVQGHLDMVCEKNRDVTHDFSNDPIRLLRDGDRVTAHGTTLGADNGIGVAMGMAAADGAFANHPPLELLLTVDEETGMSGARELDASLLSGRRMLNLDAEEEGVLYVGCAGGQDTHAVLPLERTPWQGEAVDVELQLRGLKGGHSGLDIIRNRGNAIRLLAEALISLGADGFRGGLLLIEGGSKRNAIPREARAVLRCSPDQAANLPKQLPAIRDRLLSLHADSESGLILEASVTTPSAVAPIAPDHARRLLRFIQSVPGGVITMSQAVPGLVETSNNLGVLTVTDVEARAILCSRSSNMPALGQLTDRIATVAALCDMQTQLEGGYPGWQPDMSSPLLARTKAVFSRLLGHAPEVTAIHAGLECGLLGGRLPDLDMISFGPDITGAHSPDESVGIQSVATVFDQVGAVLADLCTA